MSENNTYDEPLEPVDADEPDEFVASSVGMFEDEDESYLVDEPRLWDGDTGNMDAKPRNALVALLKKAFVSSDDVEWKALLQHRGAIATNLSNLYFNLVIDERAEVAYASPARTADNPFRTLVRDAPNNREETLLLLFLRERFRAGTASGEAHVFTDGIAMYDYVKRFRPDSAHDQVGDEKRVTNAIAGFVKDGLLVKTADDGRYRVHRAIEALLPMTRLNQLLGAFQRLQSGEPEEPETYGGKHAAPEEVLEAPEDDEEPEQRGVFADTDEESP